MTKLLLFLALGALGGAALGYFGQCTSGTCPLTANWKRGAIYGSVLAVVMFFGSGGFSSTKANQSSPNVKKITADEFEAEVLRAKGPVVVDFFAPWCGPCRRLSPMLDELAGEFKGQLKVVKVNVDEAKALASRYEIQGIPALKFFKNGEVEGGMVGLPSKSALQSQLKQLAETQTAPQSL